MNFMTGSVGDDLNVGDGQIVDSDGAASVDLADFGADELLYVNAVDNDSVIKNEYDSLTEWNVNLGNDGSEYGVALNVTTLNADLKINGDWSHLKKASLNVYGKAVNGVSRDLIFAGAGDVYADINFECDTTYSCLSLGSRQYYGTISVNNGRIRCNAECHLKKGAVLRLGTKQ